MLKKDSKNIETQEEEFVIAEELPDDNRSSTVLQEGQVVKGLIAAEAEALANYDKYLRAVAELENYKKRALREKAEAIKFGNERLIRDLLPIYDAIGWAIAQMVAAGGEQALGIKEGLTMLQGKLIDALAKHGVEAIECLHRAFDPNFHEALLRRATEEFPHNTVITEIEKGFTLNGRLLRPARVEVSQKQECL
ncbi:MAG: nucleotide exchange factor GrpE [Deltaproteobacteria bacterium]|nr:nucleotide exchange factor GrpE [Deltaproteobacteria bacterium]